MNTTLLSLKNTFLNVLLAFLMLGSVASWGQQTAVYTITSISAATQSGTKPVGSSHSYSQTYNTAKQITNNNSATLTLSGYAGYRITSIILEMKSNGSSGEGTLSVLAGSTSIASVSPEAKFNTSSWYGAYSSNYVDIIKTPIDYTIGAGENVVIKIEATINSLYIQKYTINYVAAVATPTITVSPNSLTGVTASPFGSTNEKTFTVSGTALTNNISIIPPTNYEISTTTGGSFVATNPITLAQTGGVVSNTTIYARLKTGLPLGTYNGEVINITSTGAPAKTVTLDGTVSRRTITSKDNGNWSATFTWLGGIVPTSADNAIIATSDVVMDNDTYATRNSGTTTTVNSGGTLATNVTYTNNGTTTVNGTFQLNEGGFADGTAFTYGSSGTLNFNKTSGTYEVANNHIYWPASNGPFNINVLQSGVTLLIGADRTVNGTFTVGSAGALTHVDINAGVILTLNGICQINAGGFFNNAPVYGNNSKLIYNTGSVYGRGFEWSSLSGAGYPNAVQISNSTILDYPNTGGGAFSTNLKIDKDLTIDSGSALYMDYLSPLSASGSLTVGRDVVMAGNLSLGTASGGDLFIGRDWNKTGGTFKPNSRMVNFNGTSVQTLTGPTTFDYVTVSNSAGLVLANDITVRATLNLSNGLVTLGNSLLTVNATGTITGASASRYLKTNGTGQLKRTVGATDIEFPVGNSSYNPIIFNNAGTLDVYGVIVNDASPGGDNPTKTVTRKWITTEGISGGSDLSVKVQYNTGETGTGFLAATDNFIGFYKGTKYIQQVPATSSGANPFLVSSNSNLNLTALNLNTGTNYFAIGKDNGLIAVPVKLVVTAINPTSPIAENAFSITVRSQDAYGGFANVSVATDFSFTTNGNAGAIGGTVTGTIPAGQSTVTITGVLLPNPGVEVTVTATRTLGDVLAAGTSAPFTVLGKATHLVFGTAPPTTGLVNVNLSSFTVRALRADNSLDNLYTGAITISKVTGSGALTGTLTANAVAGVATFNACAFNAADTYTIKASSGTLTEVTSEFIVISPNPANAHFRSKVTTGLWNNTSSWEASIDGITGWGATTVVPTSSASSISILDTHKITISTAGVSMTNTTVKSGGVLEVETNSNFTLSGSNDIELFVNAGGTFLVNGKGHNNGNAFGLIETDGKLVAQAIGSGNDFAQYYLGTTTDGMFYFEDKAICDWKSTSNTLGSNGALELFSLYEVGDMPIFRISVPMANFGGGSTNIFNAVLEANAAFSTVGNGNKTFTGGIRGTATVKQVSGEGDLILGDGTNIPTIGGAVTLDVISAKLKLPNGANVPIDATPTIKSSDQNCTILRQGGNLTVDGTLDITNIEITNNLAGAVVVNGTLKTAHTGGLKLTNSAIPSGILTLNANSTIEYYAIGNQIISSAPDYYNITFSGSGIKTTQGPIKVNTDGLVKITGTTTVNATSNLASTSANNTAFQMEGGRLILRTGGTQPNMMGAYNLTGGIVEYADVSAKTIRSPKSYQNIEVTGTAVANSSGHITLNSGGTFSVENGGTFTINANAIVGPVGAQTVTVKNGGTFKTGDAAGFNGSTTTSVRNDIETITLLPNSTVEYGGTNQNITKIKYGNLKVSGASGVKTLGDDLIEVDNSLNVVGSLLKIETGKTLKVKNSVTTVDTQVLNPLNGIFIKDSGSLVQENNASLNSGKINMERISQPMVVNDYTYWSSPVKEFLLKSISPTTSASKFFRWDEVTQAWLVHNTGTPHDMIAGRGYIVRAPGGFTTATSLTANFIGVPNNGAVMMPVKGSSSGVEAENKWNLLGNPYPSAIDANQFISANSSFVAGTIYLWTHNTPLNAATTLGYSPNDYASWNGTGGVATSVAEEGNNYNIPNGYVAAGQSFFIRGIRAFTENNEVTFNNSMRVDGSAEKNSQFFRTANGVTDSPVTQEKHRVWLNLTGAQNAFNQTLVGYVNDATNAYDLRFDGESFGGNKVTFYSVLDTKSLVIQGRALPFSNLDTVPLGYSTTLTGNLTISIDHVDGLMETQTIYVQDNVLNVEHNLKTSNYTFATVPGTFNNRFVLRYVPQADLSNPSFDEQVKAVLIYKNKQQLHVNSPYETIATVAIYDIAGRLIFEQKNCNTNQFENNSIFTTPQALIVKVTLNNGAVVTQKVL